MPEFPEPRSRPHRLYKEMSLEGFRMFLEADEEHYDALTANIPLPDDVYLLDRLFSQAGKQLLVAGGAVRDFLFSGGGKYSPKDIDLATNATPQEIIAILSSPEARAAGVRVFPKGEAFGVISAMVGDEEYEIATFREDWYDPDSGDGRRPDQVRYSSAAQDAKRRDLTMNALFYDIRRKEIRDYNLDENGKGMGLRDIRNRIARPVGNARDRFREDKLRIPRLVRFFSRFNPGDMLDHLDERTLEAIREYGNLAGVSPERIANEFLTGLAKSLNPVSYIRNYASLGLLPAVFPGLKVELDGLERIGNSRNPRAILAWLFRHTPAREVKARLNTLKYPADIFDRVEYLLQLFRLEPAKIVQLLQRRDLWKQDKDVAAGMARRSLLEGDVREFARIAGLERQLDHFLAYQPVARSQDFMHLKGADIGRAMSRAEQEAYLASKPQP